ncbi:hypothetical protein [Xanthobacter sp. YC-JY1]|uniref:hypothetical protein n=1 Tax=Xanthobacter sp. YC-JY1 TaxID=2419844 RepID=UPI001F33EFF9|nr:hypothetical protein [Xanthobacter sp. YC-JY1]UJX45771.1 hypothetical protein D7006_14350 [Xanthobacter sp. YC-JY1]
MSTDHQTYIGPANFTAKTVTGADGKPAVELHVPGFFTWTICPRRAFKLSQDVGRAVADALSAGAKG